MRSQKLWLADFRTENCSKENWYDIDYDAVLIEQSIAKQYHVLPSEQGDLHYSDWSKMVSGLMDDTPLGRIVAVRSEKNQDILKKYTPEQRRIRSEWQAFLQNKKQKENEENMEQRMASLSAMLAALFS